VKIYDLTFDVETGMPNCGTPWHQIVEVSQLGKLETVGRNTQRIVLGSHSGTHMDAPFHFINDGITMDKLDINLMWGKVTVVDMRHKAGGDKVTLSDVKKLEITERMLFAFGWYHNWKTEKYYKGFPYFETSAIDYLISQGLKFIAMDTPSPDDGNAIKIKGEGDSPNHISLLKNGVIIVEYLANTDVLVGGKEYEIVSLPLKIKGSDGSPARVLVKEEDE
jgi:arylformamidase